MKTEKPMPVLHGDGVTDDTEALQALISGEAAIRLDGSLVSGVPNGSFFISSALVLK